MKKEFLVEYSDRQGNVYQKDIKDFIKIKNLYEFTRIYSGMYGVKCPICKNLYTPNKKNAIFQKNPNLYFCFCGTCKNHFKIKIIKRFGFFVKKEIWLNTINKDNEFLLNSVSEY